MLKVFAVTNNGAHCVEEARRLVRLIVHFQKHLPGGGVFDNCMLQNAGERGETPMSSPLACIGAARQVGGTPASLLMALPDLSTPQQCQQVSNPREHYGMLTYTPQTGIADATGM